MRRILSSIITGSLIGALVLGVAWAAAGLIPGESRTPTAPHPHRHAIDQATVAEASGAAVGQRLPDGLFRVGTADVSIAPVQYPDGPWLAHRPGDNDPSDGTVNCSRFNESLEAQVYQGVLAKPGCINTFDGVWATGVDDVHELGLQARAMAISNGETTIAFAALDVVSWFYGYDPKLCPDNSEPLPQDTCGSRAITHSLSHELEQDLGVVIPPENFVIAASHTHASPDTAKGAPSWYFQWVRDQTKEALKLAVADMLENPVAQIQIGSMSAKPFNIDRRIITRAIPDYELSWLRAVTVAGTQAAVSSEQAAAPEEGSGNKHGHDKPGHPKNSPSPTPTPTPTPTPDPTEDPEPETIATLVNYSVHTTVTAGNAQMHSGFVGHLDRRLEELWGGNSVFIPGGLGDQTVVRNFGRDGHGYGLADLVVRSARQTGYTLKSNQISTLQRIVTVPADNLSLVALNRAGAFVRDSTIPGHHASGPSHSHQQKEGANTPSCVGSSPVSAKTPVGGFVIGTPGTGVVRDGANNEGSGTVYPYDVYAGDAIAIMQAPGEIFSSISTVTKDYMSRTRNVMVMGMANDHLGYIIPAEQYDVRSANAAGIAQPSIKTFNYEESLSTGRCTGDQIQNHLIEIGKALGLLGVGEKGSSSRELAPVEVVPTP